MDQETRHIKVRKWIAAGKAVVEVQVDALLLPDCPNEPSFTPETARFLAELQRLADAGKIDELAKHGTVYVRRSA